jgi:ComF family protein
MMDGLAERISTAGRTMARTALDILFPRRCAACRVFLPAPERHSPVDAMEAFTAAVSRVLCRTCAARLVPLTGPICTRCGKPFIGPDQPDHRCGDCLRKSPAFATARAFGIYDGPLMALIRRLKFDRRLELAEPVGRLLGCARERAWPEAIFDRVTVVPLHPRRFRKRGYNQVMLPIRRWTGFAGGAVLDRELLRRIRHTPPQSGLGRAEREQNIRGAFAVRPGCRLTGERILLVDDVYTTGATVNACAAVLVSAGAGRVDVLTIARTG